MPTDLTGTPVKTCTRCGQVKPLTEFYIHRRNDRGAHPTNPDGLYRQAACKECRALYKRAVLYGVSTEFLRQLLEAQEEFCAICGEPLPSDWHVDHDHETGEVRGLLCGRCNTGIGWFSDNPEILERAISYLTSGGVVNAY